MIVRKILTDPSSISSFDFFNDYGDTMRFLEKQIRFSKSPANILRMSKAADELKAQYEFWIASRITKVNQ